MVGRALLWALMLAMAVAGLVLLIGGIILVVAGGSFYYLIAGAALTACAVGLWGKWRWAIPLYGALLIGTLIWAVAETGLYGWALVPRLVAPTVLGLVLLLPAVRRRSGSASVSWIGLPVAAIVLAFLASAFTGPGGSNLPGAGSMRMADAQDGEWRYWGRSLSGTRFSPLADINTGNVGKLKLAWHYESDVEPFKYHSFEATPLAVNGKLYICLDRNVIVALDQDTGKEQWRFDPKPNFEGVFAANCRGVTYYQAPEGTDECATRILFGVVDARLMAVDAETGELCRSFANNGAIDLREGLGEVTPGHTYPTSPPTIVNGVVALGGWVSDGLSANMPSGVIRGYDAVTGELLWAWDYGRSDPQAPLAENETYTRSSPNAWSVFSGDEELGLLYVPTGVSSPDVFGGNRSPEADKYGNSVIAIEAATGKPRWHFQTVHHDLWDLDVASQPVLTDIDYKGKSYPALIQPTKRGEFYILDRRDGAPIYPVTERPVPQGGVKEDRTAKTQPYSSFPNLTGPPLTEADMWGVTPLDQLWCRIRFAQARYEGEFTPPSLKSTLQYPGPTGGMNWGSVSIDPAHKLMVVNSLYIASIGQMFRREDEAKARKGAGLSPKAQFFLQEGTPYVSVRSVFLSPLGVPCQEPPYGRISAFDLETGKLRWTKPLGTAYHAGPLGMSSYLPLTMGVPNLGGSITTAGGLAFIGAAQDRKLRAIDIGNAEELWSFALPAVAGATPMTYRSPKTGKQYVVIAAGGSPALPGPEAGSVMAFALE